ncbi:MAG: hypothetical protein IT385_06170 [Deltaproteobacteria bacterium]|nr:hypothetical protein [Deltaproteobacteria bacterium]
MHDRLSAPSPTSVPGATPAAEPGPGPRANLRGMDFASQVDALTPAPQGGAGAKGAKGAHGGKAGKPSLAEVDRTFNAWWARLGKTADTIDRALAKTREQLRDAMPASYVPPVRRPNAPGAGGDGAPRVDAREVFDPARLPDPRGKSERPSDTATCDLPDEPQGQAPGHDAAPRGPGTAMNVEQKLPEGFAIKWGTDGITAELSCSKEFKRHIPILGPIGIQASFSAKAFGSVTLGSGDVVTTQLGAAEAEGRVALAGAVPGVGAVYGGGFAKVSFTGLTLQYHPATGWSLAGPLASLKVAPVVGFELEVTGTKLDVSPGGELEVVRAGWINGAFTIEKGADWDYLVSLVTESEHEARERAAAKKANETGGGASGASGNPG